MANISWIAESGDWYNPANWSSGTVPAESDNATIDISGASATITFSGGNPTVDRISLFARNGGELTLNGLQSFTGRSEVRADGTGSSINLPDLTSFVDDTPNSVVPAVIEAINGGSIQAENLDSLTEVDLTINGSTVTLPLTTYNGDNSVNVSNGGVLTIGGLQNITGGTVIKADGTNSVINLSGTISFVDDTPNSVVPAVIEAINGGSIQADNLNSITAVNLISNNGGELTLNGLETIIGSSNSGSSIRTEGTGSIINLPDLTSFVDDTPNSVAPAVIEVINGGSIQADNLDSLTEVDLTINGSTVALPLTTYNGDNFIQAVSSGELRLRNLRTISDGTLSVLADGQDSIVEISRLSENNDSLELEERNNGRIVFSDSVDLSGVTITQSSGSTNITEGGATDDYMVVLDAEPTADVIISIASDDQSTTAPTSVTFAPDNWNAPQTVTVTAVDDSAVEGTHTSTISHTASSADSNYNAIQIANVIASITDNDSDSPPDAINLDIDGNGQTDALTDGVAAIRYLFQFRGDVLINNVIGIGATRTTALEITNYLDMARSTMLDVDGNGMADALTDGIMMIRYLFGFGGNAVIDGALGPDATRTTAAAIIDHLQSFDIGF
ncbi:MAG: hypothetical protein AB4352_18790 [Hormoscilla sp.]